jgi:hypothetical protein
LAAHTASLQQQLDSLKPSAAVSSAPLIATSVIQAATQAAKEAREKMTKYYFAVASVLPYQPPEQFGMIHLSLFVYVCIWTASLFRPHPFPRFLLYAANLLQGNTRIDRMLDIIDLTINFHNSEVG